MGLFSDVILALHKMNQKKKTESVADSRKVADMNCSHVSFLKARQKKQDFKGHSSDFHLHSCNVRGLGRQIKTRVV